MRNMYKLVGAAAAAALALAAAGCATATAWTISSDPPGALVTMHSKPDAEQPEFTWPAPDPDKPETTPLVKELSLFSDEKAYALLEKRGFKPAVALVTAKDVPSIEARLERIEGVPESEPFDQARLRAGSIVFLPVDVRVVVESGVGRLVKKTYSEEKSRKAAADFNEGLRKALGGAADAPRFLFAGEASAAAWAAAADGGKKYLASLNPARLPYSSYPPLLEAAVPESSAFFDSLRAEPHPEDCLLCFVRVECLTETAGRVAGNILLGIAGAAVSGASPGMYYDPTAFESSSGTLYGFYIIDPSSSEVLFARRFSVGSDLTGDKALAWQVDNLVGIFHESQEKKKGK